MNVSEITFGVEIECYVPITSAIQPGGYHSGLPCSLFPTGWTVQHDGSLQTRRRGYRAVEVVSPILKGIDGLHQIKAVLAVLNSETINASVNDRCGFHVHVGVGSDLELVRKLTFLVANHEKAIYATTGTKNRERGTYSAPIAARQQGYRFEQGTLGTAAADRYRSLNLQNLVTRSKPTVEFRAFAGTLNFEKIVGYVRLAVGMVERAAKAKRQTNWTAKPVSATSPIHRKGEGQTAVTRMFYQLGWIKGRQSHTFGNLTDENLPTIRNTKRAMMKMARKYDAQQ